MPPPPDEPPAPIDEASEMYVLAIQMRLQTGLWDDSTGKRIETLLASELRAVGSFLEQMAAQSEATKRGSTGKTKETRFAIALELEPDARKHVVVNFGLVPMIASLIESEQATPKPGIVYLGCNSNSEAGAKMAWGRWSFLSGLSAAFGTWDDLVGSYSNNYSGMALSNHWLIGDMDWDDTYGRRETSGPKLEGFATALRVPNNKIFICQKGQPSIVPFPPRFAAARCFIATAVCGPAPSWEVNALQEFRDRVLLRSRVGRRAVDVYYTLSPPLARWIDGKPQMQSFFRRFVIAPLARGAAKRVMRTRTERRTDDRRH